MVEKRTIDKTVAKDEPEKLDNIGQTKQNSKPNQIELNRFKTKQQQQQIC